MSDGCDSGRRGSDRRRRIVLAICCLAIVMVGLDTSMLNVALPSLQRDLGASVAGAQWTVDAYVLVLACLLLSSGSTADRIGRRRTFKLGLAVFTGASLLCSVAPGLGWLVAFRMLQGAGGSMLTPVALSIVANVFTEPSDRARAIGWWGGAAGISVAAGPLLGGVLVETVGWRSIFLINVPVGALALFLTGRFVPESRAPRPRAADPVGQALVIGTVGLLVFAIIEEPRHGWEATEIAGCLVGAVVCLIALVLWERRSPEPLIDPRFFLSPPFSGACGVAICTYLALGGFLFLNTLYLQDVRGYSALGAGLAFFPVAALMMVCGPLCGRVVARRGPRAPLLIGGAGLLASGLLGALGPGEPALARLLAGYVLIGAGLGWLNAAITDTAVAGMPREQAGVAAATASTMRQLGLALGAAVIGSVIAARAGVASPGPGFAAAYRVSWSIIGCCGFLVVAIAALTTGGRAQRRATRNALRIAAGERPRPLS